jgi:carboxypeptidase family protein
MTKTRDLLARARVARTCDASWELMTGDDRVRFCAECNKSVYNISSMTRAEAEDLLIRTAGQLCARFERGPDGRVITITEPVAAPRQRMRVRKLISALAATFLSASVGAAATPGVAPQGVIQDATKSKRDRTSPAKDESSGILSGTVVDSNGARIAGARVTVENRGKRFKESVVTSQDGEFRFSSLPVGSLSITFEAAGFEKKTIKGVVAGAKNQIELRTALNPAEVTMGGPMEFYEVIEPTPPIDIKPLPERKIK